MVRFGADCSSITLLGPFIIYSGDFYIYSKRYIWNPIVQYVIKEVNFSIVLCIKIIFLWMLVDKNVIHAPTVVWQVILLYSLYLFLVIFTIDWHSLRSLTKVLFNILGQLVCNNTMKQLSFFFLEFLLYKLLLGCLRYMIVLGNLVLMNLNILKNTSFRNSDFYFISHNTASQEVFGLGIKIFC